MQAERLIHQLIPLNESHRQDQERVRDELWTLYADLKAYPRDPDPAAMDALRARFEALFTQKTSFATLNHTLKRLYTHQSEWLLVLLRPDVPLHTNGSENDIRGFVKWRKVSGGTRSDLGRRCRDTFASLKKTCRKLGISFWDYPNDRIGQVGAIPPFARDRSSMLQPFLRFFLIAFVLYAGSAGAAPRVGEPAPDFTGVDTQGQTHRLADDRGKTVVLEWTNHDCPYVRKHYGAGNLQEQQREAAAQGVIWLSVISSAPGQQSHVSPAEADERTRSRQAAPHAVLLDPEGGIGGAYGAKTTPARRSIRRSAVRHS